MAEADETLKRGVGEARSPDSPECGYLWPRGSPGGLANGRVFVPLFRGGLCFREDLVLERL